MVSIILRSYRELLSLLLSADWPLARFSLTEKSTVDCEEYNGKL